MVPKFVKKFDFRGIYGTDITDRDSYYLGLALSKTLTPKKVLIGWDTRVSSKNLALRFMTAINNQNIAIAYLPQCPIDYVTAGANALDFDLSVMFTGSHNPWNWTGLLMHTKGGNSIQGTLVDTIVQNFHDAEKQPYKEQNASLTDFENVTETIETLYAEKLQSLIPLSEIQPFSVLVDIGDGSGDKALTLLEKLLPQVTFTRINNRDLYDETSSHTADPSNIENMQDLIKEVQRNSYDCGFAFDSDADRVLGVDEKGTYLNGSLLGSTIVASLDLLKSTDTKFGYAVDCGPSFHNTVVTLNEKHDRNYRVQPLPVGRSLMRKMLTDKTIDVGIENVGHFYTKDFFMTDSGVFTLAVILYWMSKNGALSTLFEKYPDGMREQTFLPLSENTTDVAGQVLKKLKELYPQRTINTIDVDGIRYEVGENNTITTWFAMRTSGYEAIQKYFFGSLNKDIFRTLKEVVDSLIKKE